MPSSGALQKVPTELVDILSAFFRRRHEANYAFADAISMYQAIGGLRGFWPTSSVNESNSLIDMSGQGFPLAANGTPSISYLAPTLGVLAPCIINGGTGTNDCYYSADAAHWDILGNESHITSSRRGITLGAWVYSLDHITEDRWIIGKWGAAAGDRSYSVEMQTTGTFRFRISDGAATDSIAESSASGDGEWFFVAGRWNPGSEVKLWVDDNTYTNTVGIMNAPLNNSAANFVVGARGDLTYGEWDGYITLPFLSAMQLRDEFLFTLYHQTRALFNK